MVPGFDSRSSGPHASPFVQSKLHDLVAWLREVFFGSAVHESTAQLGIPELDREGPCHVFRVERSSGTSLRVGASYLAVERLDLVDLTRGLRRAIELTVQRAPAQCILASDGQVVVISESGSAAREAPPTAETPLDAFDRD